MRFSVADVRLVSFAPTDPVVLVGFDAATAVQVRAALAGASVSEVRSLPCTAGTLQDLADGAARLLLAYWDGEPGAMADFLAELQSTDEFRAGRLRFFVITQRISIVAAAKKLGASMVIRTPFPASIFAEALPRLRYHAAA